MVELRQSPHFARFLAGIGWQTPTLPSGPFAYVKKLPGLPLSVIKIQRPCLNQLDFAAIRTLCRQHHALACYLEINQPHLTPIQPPTAKPDISIFATTNQLMRPHGYRPVKNGMLATKTQILNLKLPPNTLQRQFKPKTRYNLNLALRHHLHPTIISADKLLAQPTNLRNFLQLIRLNAHRVGYWAVPDSWTLAKLKAFGPHAFVVFVYQSDRLLATSLFLTTTSTCFYSFNGSSASGRSLFAPTVAVWAGITEARRRRLSQFDFDGVYDARFPNRRWLGYTRFKAGFGGRYLYYPPAYLKWFPSR